MRSLAATLGVLLCVWSTRAVAQDAAAPPPPLEPAPLESAPLAPVPPPHVPEAAPHYQQPPPPPQHWQWDEGTGDGAPRRHFGFYTHIQLMGALFGAGDLTHGLEDGLSLIHI